MNRIIISLMSFGKMILNTGKFFYRNIAVKMNSKNLSQKTEMSYLEAFRLLNDLHPIKEVDFSTQCEREKQISYDVSIIVPVYNAEKYLKSCITSIIKQRTKFSYELICVNDGSSDSSLKILYELCNNNSDVIIVDQINQGSSAARNVGMKIARGKYFFFIDADDFLPSNAIDLLLKAALDTNADIVQGSIAKCKTDGEIYYINKCKQSTTCNLLEYYNSNMNGTAWGKLYKRELWDNINFFEGYAYEDAIIWCNIYPKCKKMTLLPDVIYIFRTQENSLFKRQNNSIQCLDAIWIIKHCMQLFNIMSTKESAEWYQMMLWQLSVGIVTRIKYLDNDELFQAAFIIAKHLAEQHLLFCQIEFKGKNKDIYKKIETDFLKLQYKKWIAHSDTLLHTNEV